jgi:hypothetical protein
MVARRKRSAVHRERAAQAVDHETFARAIDEIMRMLNDHLRELEALRDEQRIQFNRIAQLQAELDSVKQLAAKLL